MKFVPEVIGRQIARNSLLAQKASPQILFGVGVAGMVGSTVLACRATLKMETVLDEAKGKLDTARSLQHRDYSEKDRSRDISLIYFQSGVKVAKAYAPAIIVGGISIYALTSSHRILTRRNNRNLRYGTTEMEIVDPKTKKKKTVTRVDPNDPSIYARFFDPVSPSWSKEPEYNMIFLKCQQNYANDLLRSRGHVFLNEVYDMCGIDRSKAGAGEGAILLDFNVDGVIYDKLDD